MVVVMTIIEVYCKLLPNLNSAWRTLEHLKGFFKVNIVQIAISSEVENDNSSTVHYKMHKHAAQDLYKGYYTLCWNVHYIYGNGQC